MKETIAHILEVVVVVIALFAVIAIITNMTKIGDGTRDANGRLNDGSGIITQQIDDTVGDVFEKTDSAIQGSSTNINGEGDGTNNGGSNNNANSNNNNNNAGGGSGN